MGTGSACWAEAANLAPTESSQSGPAARVVLAHSLYQAAIEQGDPVLLVAAIRLARGITLRPVTGWTRTTAGAAAPDQPAGRPAPPDPASPEVLAMAEALADEDPTLQDLVYGIVAQVPHGRQATAIEARAELAGGQIDTWRVALSGDVPAEFGLIGDGDTDLGLSVLDEGGNVVCSVSPGKPAALCRFTPARNGFFDVRVESIGMQRNSYRLVGGG
ncbi:hypothetical protein [Rhodobacter calidifons]|nr:hypothetical protein [Rhodobacter calidifons]